MAKTRLLLNKLTLLEKIALGQQICIKMTGNPAFPPPVPCVDGLPAAW